VVSADIDDGSLPGKPLGELVSRTVRKQGSVNARSVNETERFNQSWTIIRKRGPRWNRFVPHHHVADSELLWYLLSPTQARPSWPSWLTMSNEGYERSATGWSSARAQTGKRVAVELGANPPAPAFSGTAIRRADARSARQGYLPGIELSSSSRLANVGEIDVRDMRRRPWDESAPGVPC